jgi:hypothetical protein
MVLGGEAYAMLCRQLGHAGRDDFVTSAGEQV